MDVWYNKILKSDHIQSILLNSLPFIAWNRQCSPNNKLSNLLWVSLSVFNFFIILLNIWPMPYTQYNSILLLWGQSINFFMVYFMLCITLASSCPTGKDVFNMSLVWEWNEPDCKCKSGSKISKVKKILYFLVSGSRCVHTFFFSHSLFSINVYMC